MTKADKALAYFKDGFHCSQAVLAAYAEDLGLTEEQALKLGACFGSGVRKGELCGACSGALMVLGLKYGQAEKDDLESRQKTNEVTDEFLEVFEKRNGSYICRDLLKCDIRTAEGLAQAKENQLFRLFCPKMVASAVTILEKM